MSAVYIRFIWRFFFLGLRFTFFPKTRLMAGLSIFRAEDALALSNSTTILSVSLSESAASYLSYTDKSSKFSKPGSTSTLAIIARRIRETWEARWKNSIRKTIWMRVPMGFLKTDSSTRKKRYNEELYLNAAWRLAHKSQLIEKEKWFTIQSTIQKTQAAPSFCRNPLRVMYDRGFDLGSVAAWQRISCSPENEPDQASRMAA